MYPLKGIHTLFGSSILVFQWSKLTECLYAYILYAFMYIHTYIHMYIHDMYIYIYICIYVPAKGNSYAFWILHLGFSVVKIDGMFVCVYIVCIYVYTYIHTYVYT